MTEVVIASKHRFSQEVSRFKCKCASHYRDLSTARGYPIRHRSQTCSLECAEAWSTRYQTALARLLTVHLPAGVSAYRGHLTLPPESSPADHQRVKAAFLLAVRRWAKRYGRRVEIAAKLHITSPTDAHWEIIVWTDSPLTPLHDFFGAAWRRAGGYHFSLTVPDNLEGSARYQGKAPQPAEKSRELFLPAPRSVLGLETVWATAGFWCGWSVLGLWSEVIAEWLERTRLHQNKITLTDTPGDQADSDQPAYRDARWVPGENRADDSRNFVRRLPTDQAKAVGLAEYAARWGVRSEYMRDILTGDPDVIVTSGQLVEGSYVYGGVYRRKGKS